MLEQEGFEVLWCRYYGKFVSVQYILFMLSTFTGSSFFDRVKRWGIHSKLEKIPVEKPKIKVNIDDMPEHSHSALERMRAILTKVLKHLQGARDERDVVKLNCVNEKLTAVKGLLKIAEQADVGLQEQEGDQRDQKQVG